MCQMTTGLTTRSGMLTDVINDFSARLRSPPAQRYTRRRSALRCAPLRRLWYGEPDAITNAIGYAKFRSRSHGAVIRVYDEIGQRGLARAWKEPRNPDVENRALGLVTTG